MFVVVVGILVDDEAQMWFACDQDSVGGLASAGSHPALGDRVHPRHARKDGHHPGADSVEDRVEALSEVAGVVADQVPDADGACVVQAHEEVSGALGGPSGGDVAGDTGDVDATGVVLDEEQDEQTPREHRVHVEDVNGEDARGLGLEEPGPGAAGPLGRRVDPGVLQDLPNGGGGDLPAQVQQFAMDTAIPPSVVFAGQAQHQSA
ncbi:hypothetical protein GCM10022206_61200 [Streptomyces chiangmaiensis]